VWLVLACQSLWLWLQLESDLKHLLNVETRFYCPQEFALFKICSVVGMTFVSYSDVLGLKGALVVLQAQAQQGHSHAELLQSQAAHIHADQ